MKFYNINAFTDSEFFGNPAGVVLCENGKFPDEDAMQNFARDLAFSETAFVINERGRISIRFFTPESEVDMCGHATLATFKALLAEKIVEPGKDYSAYVNAGKIQVKVEPRFISMTMPHSRVLSTVKDENSQKLIYKALGTDYELVRFQPQCCSYKNLDPMVVTAGLPFLIVPIKGRDKLNWLRPNMPLIEEISKGLGCDGIYAFAFEEREVGTMAHCRGFYPLLGIEEECATGTAVAALSFYLNGFGILPSEREALFVQGEAMQRKSELTAYIKGKGESLEVMVGGNGKIIETRDIEL